MILFCCFYEVLMMLWYDIGTYVVLDSGSANAWPGPVLPCHRDDMLLFSGIVSVRTMRFKFNGLVLVAVGVDSLCLHGVLPPNSKMALLGMDRLWAIISFVTVRNATSPLFIRRLWCFTIRKCKTSTLSSIHTVFQSWIDGGNLHDFSLDWFYLMRWRLPRPGRLTNPRSFTFNWLMLKLTLYNGNLAGLFVRIEDMLHLKARAPPETFFA